MDKKNKVEYTPIIQDDIVRDLDDIYDDKEFKEFKKEYDDGI